MRRPLLALYRVRLPVYYAVAAVLVGNLLMGRLGSTGAAGEARLAAVFTALALAALWLLAGLVAPRWLPAVPARVVAPPVRGRWLGLNSPASKVPSHGTRALGQAYAIDIVCEPADAPRPGFAGFCGPAMRPPREYPAFGRPVYAMAGGTVVRASGWRRGHRARSNWWGLAYLTAEGMIREAGGPGFMAGNHVTIRADDGVYAMVAHLQQGSVAVKAGDRVSAGDLIGRCGNSGNSSEPHVHAQLMDRASLWTAHGLPMAFAGISLGDDPDRIDALPKNGQHMAAPGSARSEAW